MSGKIKAKDLSYDSTLPPFLQKLHARNAGRGDVDRHERPLARPSKVKEADAEDEPTVVDEHGETLTKDELAGLAGQGKAIDDESVVVEDSASNDARNGADASAARASVQTIEQATRPRDHVTDGIVHKKRKIAKVVGDTPTHEGRSDAKSKVMKSSKVASKAKKPKLAFVEDEE